MLPSGVEQAVRVTLPHDYRQDQLVNANPARLRPQGDASSRTQSLASSRFLLFVRLTVWGGVVRAALTVVVVGTAVGVRIVV
jgi:hypothetical protein